MKKKSLGVNALLNGIRNILAVLFPLITFPYVSRILQVDNLGKYNFALSVVDYFILFAGLGISTYAVRECAKVRDDPAQISQLASELFSINVISMILSYILLFIIVVAVPKLHDYNLLIAIFSFELLFRTFGTEWIYAVFEEYGFLTKRGIFFQILSLILLFLFVKKQEDLYIYACITVLADAGSNIVNFIYARKLCKIKFLWPINYKPHIKAVMIIFATTVATTIYVSSDTTILGFMTADYHVGLYAVAVKIYRVAKMCLSAVLVVSIPRLSNYLGCKQYDKYNLTFNQIFNTLLVIVVPAVVGLFCISKETILFLSDTNYVEATNSLRLLSLALLVCLFGWLFNSCVLIPNKKEDKVLIATIISAVINVLLNLILIPLWKQDAAAFTTFIAEGVSMILCIYYSRGLIRVENFLRSLISVCVGCIGVATCCYLLKMFMFPNLIYIIISMVSSLIMYAIILLLSKNQCFFELLSIIKGKLHLKSPNK